MAVALTRALLVLSSAIVGVRMALASREQRERSRSAWQLTWLAMVTSFVILFWHPFHVPTPRWYDVAVRPLAVAIMLTAAALVS